MSKRMPLVGSATISRYITGFVLSVLATLVIYVFVQIHVTSGHRVLTDEFLTIIVAILAVTQFIVQAVFFLHLGNETKSQIKIISFLFMLLVVGILVIGSLWIMDNLNYTKMSPQETNSYLHNNEGL